MLPEGAERRNDVRHRVIWLLLEDTDPQLPGRGSHEYLSQGDFEPAKTEERGNAARRGLGSGEGIAKNGIERRGISASPSAKQAVTT
jgi:hypothetical protein